MNFMRISREVEKRNLLSPLLMHQRLRHEFAPSRPIVSNGCQYSPLRFDELIAAPPLAMHLTFKSHVTLPSTLPSGAKPWINRSPGLSQIEAEVVLQKASAQKTSCNITLDKG
ncbi:hypothetical protein KOW79_020510 [Hemibagrus wyckioides]|uniref:Uncharacterized protein n=1 Tax=Hemibagrus wyckioides TaxID=337641 RepID=A0A9D3N6H8_9TELE|nr:hypothetical protein KOW79_020510 [Hemibagrus wyckioides]